MLAQECAKILALEGVKDFAKAKRKAADRLGAGHRSLLPSNVEIEQALVSYQELFMAEDQTHWLNLLRTTAIRAMQLLERFQPRLVGSVLHGTASMHSAISLHLFADTPEDVIFFLLDRDIPFESSARRLRLGNANYADFPVIELTLEQATVDLTIFEPRSQNDPPWSPIDGKPMRRVPLAEVQTLVQG